MLDATHSQVVFAHLFFLSFPDCFFSLALLTTLLVANFRSFCVSSCISNVEIVLVSLVDDETTVVLHKAHDLFLIELFFVKIHHL